MKSYPAQCMIVLIVGVHVYILSTKFDAYFFNQNNLNNTSKLSSTSQCDLLRMFNCTEYTSIDYLLHNNKIKSVLITSRQIIAI